MPLQFRKKPLKKGWHGRFGAGLPRISDGSLLFVQHMISKMKPYNPRDLVNEPGSRIAVVLNGSPLFTGGAGQGESEIRRWILENDWLEAIIALPDQMFYNTGILTYIWVLSNRKEKRRRNKVQLIDATGCFQRMRKPLGEKRKELTEEHIAEIARLYGDFQESDRCMIFETEEFAFHEVTVERPLRLRFQVTDEVIQSVRESKTFTALAESKKRNESERVKEIEAGKQLQHSILEVLGGFDSEAIYMNRDEFTRALRKALSAAGVKLGMPVLRKLVAEIGVKDPQADVCLDAKGNLEPDKDLRDTEQIPFREDIEAYFEREVKPYAPDAWIDESKTKVGYEIPFTRYFYKYEDLGNPSDTLIEIQALAKEIDVQISRLFEEMTV